MRSRRSKRNGDFQVGEPLKRESKRGLNGGESWTQPETGKVSGETLFQRVRYKFYISNIICIIATFYVTQT